MTDALAHRASAHWGWQGAPLELAACRENAVYRVQTDAGPVALRLHRPGLRTLRQLQSELQWMAALQDGGLAVPAPIPLPDGSLCTSIDDTVVDALRWLDGVPMGRNGVVTERDELPGVYRALGRAMARLHLLSDRWRPPAGFERPAWDLAGLVGEAPLWGRYWDNPTLAPDQARLLAQARDKARRLLADALPGLDAGLVHADLVPDNVIIDGTRIQLIDFDDGGHGFRLFELATTLNRATRLATATDLRAALLQGYQDERPIDLGLLPVFEAVRSFTYVGWIIPRLGEPGAAERNRRFIGEACAMAHRLLNTPAAASGSSKRPL
ncbi:MAG: phosphotransferase [Burkholderiaceae bacterium]